MQRRGEGGFYCLQIACGNDDDEEEDEISAFGQTLINQTFFKCVFLPPSLLFLDSSFFLATLGLECGS